MKHALTREKALDLDAVNTAYEVLASFGLKPGLGAMGMAGFMERLAGLDHLVGDPGALIRAHDLSAVFHNLVKRLIDREVECGLFSGPSQASWNVNRIELKNRSLYGAKPGQHRKAFNRPR